ncbi:MAG: nicotinate phosphoribosyltransferase [Acidobacteria bacterium]|nr:MAG: nicotinate phosphoribosyltransferase [Acidobacteriota bacterium]
MPQQLRVNPIIGTDSYKITHWWQYPPDAEIIYSHLMSRGGFWKNTLFNGLQGILLQFFVGQVFTKEDVEDARKKMFAHFGNDKAFNYAGWMRLLEKHGGKLPLKIRAVAEGTLVPVKNCLMTIENTDPEFPWLTNWAETRLMQVWYPITVGTLSFEIKQVIGKDLVRTGDPSLLPFKLHDFGYRGVSSELSAAIGGAAHLINFMGTDTLAAIEYLQQFYGADEMPGFSIPAMEHSTVTSWGKEHEADSYANMLDRSPDGLVACVIDSYDTHNAVAEIFGNQLREKVLRRNGKLVLRPDSGDPVVVMEDIFNAVAEKFGFEANTKGWKVLPKQIRVIQGDGVNYQNILRINSALTRAGWSMDNWGYGMGGALLQQLNRDTMRFAIKCSAIRRNGVWQEVHKSPKTDLTKASIGGRLNLIANGHGEYVTIASNEEMAYGNVLRSVFEDGELKIRTTLKEVRELAATFDRYNEEALEPLTP